MKIIRKGTFETNSSSTHAIVVPHKVSKDKWNIDDSLEHDYTFGRYPSRLVDEWDEKLAYVYMIIKENCDKKTIKKFKDRVWEIWKQVVKEYLDNDTYYDMDTEDILPLTDSMKKERYSEFVKNNKDGYRNPNPKDVFKYIDDDKDNGDLTGRGVVILGGYGGNYVDHVYDYDGDRLIEQLSTNDDFVKRLVFNKDAYITISGDEYRGYNIKTIGYEYDYDEEPYYVNAKGEKMPDLKDVDEEERYNIYKEYDIPAGEFWDRLKEYSKDKDVYLH